MTDYAGAKYGGVTFPLEASSLNSPLQDADPTIFHALSFFSAMIVTHVGPRLMAEVEAIGPRPTVDGKNGIPSPVAMAVSYDPAPWLTQNQFKFPLLAVHRKTGTYNDRTVVRRQNIVEAEVSYIFPPLTAAQAQRILPLRKAIGQLLAYKTDKGADPTYTPPGATLGSSAWEAAGLTHISIEGEAFGGYAAGEDLYFPAWTGRLQIAERTDILTSDYEDLVTASLDVDLAQPGTVTYEDLVQVISDTVP
jgi:hypothetical protein